MSYTVKDLSNLSKVSVRTLHWYDEIGLLKPAYLGFNGYRYYEEEQALKLQQILFFRELGFSLKKIGKVLEVDDFNKVSALQVHKKNLELELDRTKKLIKTIDKTIKHLRGKKMMKESELFEGFDASKQAEYEEYLVKCHGTIAEELILESKRNMGSWSKKEKREVFNEGNDIYKEMAECIEKGLNERSDEVQALVKRHFDMNNKFYKTSKDVYVGLSQMYVEVLEFGKYFDKFHPKLSRFISEAMRVFAHKNLS
jgi:DNA-binding transcriptional MerR regulator